MSQWALVLGGGGSAGNAWLIGVVAGLVDAGLDVAEAELIGLAPRAAFEGFPDDVPLRGFDPERHILEEVLRAVA